MNNFIIVIGSRNNEQWVEGLKYFRSNKVTDRISVNKMLSKVTQSQKQDEPDKLFKDLLTAENKDQPGQSANKCQNRFKVKENVGKTSNLLNGIIPGKQRKCEAILVE